MRFFVAVLVFITMIGSGIMISLRLKKREKLLEKTKLFLDCIRLDFEYSALTVQSMINKYASDDFYYSLDFLRQCNEKMNEGADFPPAWKLAVTAAQYYTKEEKSKLITLGSVLGTSDCEAQISILKIYSDYFGKYCEKSKKAFEKYGETAVYVGAFLGVCAAMMLI